MYFHGVLLLACLFTQTHSEPTFDKQEALSWSFPRELHVRFPYYFAGHDDNGSPVYIGEFGKWNFIDELKKEPASVELFGKLLAQFYTRAATDGASAPGGVGSIILADLKNLKIDATVEEFIEKSAKKFNEVNQNPGLKKIYIINANQEYMDIQEKVRPYLTHSGDKLEVYGEDATKWSPDVLKYLQLDGLQTRLGEPVSVLKEALDRKVPIPIEFQAQYLYYFSGYSKRGEPVFIVPMGKWDLRAAVEEGPQGMLKLGRIHDQLALRWNHEGIAAPGSPGSIVIFNIKGFGERQSSHNETVNFYVDLMKRADTISRSSGTAHIYVINSAWINSRRTPDLFSSNPEFEKVYNIAKTSLVTLDNKLDTFGEDSKEWMSVLLKEISPDELPEEYGGSKTNNALKIYGSVSA